MRLDIVTIGNSKGIRLPKSLLAQCGFHKTVEVEVRGEELILKKSGFSRANWSEAFRAGSQDLDQDWLDFSWEENEGSWQW